MIPSEAEVFLGQIGFAEYRTPGTAENAQIVGEVGVDHQAVIMQNHGVIVWGKDVEDAYWKMENVDSYCKVVWIASQLGAPLKTITGGQMKDSSPSASPSAWTIPEPISRNASSATTAISVPASSAPCQVSAALPPAPSMPTPRKSSASSPT